MAGLAYAVVGGIGWLAGGILGLFIGKQGDMERYIFKFYAKQKMKHAGKGDGYMIVPLE